MCRLAIVSVDTHGSRPPALALVLLAFPAWRIDRLRKAIL
jgi:hypothetical protein